MSRICDNTSVGIIDLRPGRLLQIERRKEPFGFAPPAGHVDDHGSYEDAARAEYYEEVGLIADHLELIYEGHHENCCRRPGGTFHDWKVYRAVGVKGLPVPNADEVKRVIWTTPDYLMTLMKRTEDRLAGKISDQEWQHKPGIEPVWYEIYTAINMTQELEGEPSPFRTPAYTLP
jgi:ADP-ribose pyrophosphatase YjhB (NUDIX family)